jgi:hypothetical protein
VGSKEWVGSKGWVGSKDRKEGMFLNTLIFYTVFFGTFRCFYIYLAFLTLCFKKNLGGQFCLLLENKTIFLIIFPGLFGYFSFLSCNNIQGSFFWTFIALELLRRVYSE